MIMLDTDHLSILKYENHPRSIRLQERLNSESDLHEIATTIVSVEEQMRGWLARIHSERNPHHQIEHYE
jgi:tRNA(fMet)-specific endonuclease VapC